MALVGDLVVNLGVNRRKFDSGLTGARASLGSFVSGLTRVVAPVAGILGAALGGRAAVNAARTQIEAERKLAAVLKATGGAAGLTAGEIGRLAGELQAVTNFGDEVTISAAGVLATFKEIKGAVFKDALVVAQDLSSVMGQDLKSSVVQIGKSLNDPIKGVTALQRVGVSFTSQQKEQIKTLQQSGDLLGAQAIIMKELQSEFGGAAKAMADPLTQAKNVVGDLGESIGFVLLPPLRELMSAFVGAVTPITSNTEAFKSFGEAVARVVRESVIPFIESAARWIAALRPVAPVLLGVMAVLKSMIVIQKAIAVGQAAILALSGPAGWATLAAGAAIGLAAYAGIENQFTKLQASARSATSSVTGLNAELASAPLETQLRDTQSAISKELEKTYAQLKLLSTPESMRGIAEIENRIAAIPGIELVPEAEIERLKQAMGALQKLEHNIKDREEFEAQQKAQEEDMRSRAQQLRDSIATPAEQLRDRLAEIRDLFNAGFLQESDVARLTTAAEKEFGEGGVTKNADTRIASGSERGSKEALESILKAGMRGKDPAVKVAEKQLAEQKRAADALTSLVANPPMFAVGEIG